MSSTTTATEPNSSTTMNHNKKMPVVPLSHFRSKPSRTDRASVKFQASLFVSQRFETVETYYALGQKLGEGGFGQVYACQHKETGAERAVKVIDKSLSEEENERVLHEFTILKGLDHPNIVKMYELFEDDDKFYIVTDIYRGGELLDELEQWGTLSEDDTATLLNNLLGCINYLHKKNLVHRDLKPENILLDDEMAVDDLKVIDFGLSAWHDAETDPPMTDYYGSTYYVSPQVITGSYDCKADIWSCGVIAFVCLCGYAPFDGGNDIATIDLIEAGHFDFDDPLWHDISDQAKQFVTYLLTRDDKKRPSAQEALQHPWLVQSRQYAMDDTKFQDSKRSSLAELKRFSSTGSKLKQAVCSIIACQLLPKSDKQEIDDIFRSLDLDCDGRLTMEDLKRSYDNLGVQMSDDDLTTLFQQVNYSGSGSIDYSEFAIAVLMEKNKISESHLQVVFNMFDRNDKGHIDAEDLKEVLNLNDSFDEYITEKIIQQVDSDGDGKIDFGDFKQMMFQTMEDPNSMPIATRRKTVKRQPRISILGASIDDHSHMTQSCGDHSNDTPGMHSSIRRSSKFTPNNARRGGSECAMQKMLENLAEDFSESEQYPDPSMRSNI